MVKERTLKDLVRLVAMHGLELHGSYLPEGVSGYWDAEEGRIYFDLSLTPSERKSTVGHELGHFFNGHDCSTPANERQADAYAARILIHPDDYAAAARVNTDRSYIAEELGVEEYIVEAFEKHCLTRIGDRVYPKGRWAALTSAFW